MVIRLSLDMKNQKERKPSEAILLNEIELLLAEKRTYYSTFRTGIAIITTSLTVIIFLLATKDYHRIFDNKTTATAVLIVLSAMVITGIVMTIVSTKKIKVVDVAVKKIEKENKRVENIIV
jgi:VIT1/CCC1 family predicted Fe2+/Mn2+ transporter